MFRVKVKFCCAMQLSISISFFLLIVIASKVSEGKMIVDTSNSRGNSELLNAAVNIVKTCYGKTEATVGIIGRFDTALLKAMCTDPAMPVILIDKTAKNQKNIQKIPKIDIFLMTMFTWLKLQKKDMNLESLIWWNPDASYLIIDELTESTKFESCVADNENFIGQMTNVFNVKILCFRQKQEIDIYYYRSRFDKTSSPWNLHRKLEHAASNTSDVYVFTRSYQENDDKLCVNIKITKKSTETFDWVVISSGETY